MNTETPLTPADTSSQHQYLSRKERREMQRTEQQGGQHFETRKKLFRRVLIWGVGVAVLGGIGWGIIHLANKVQLPAEGGTLAVPVSDTDHTTGSATAPITLVEYSDFQCPACGAFYPLVKKLLSEPEAKDKIKFVYRNFPLTQIHQNAQLAAQAAQAAALQNKFWEMHDKLFENQTKWSGQTSVAAKKTFIQFATELKLNITTFSKDIESDVVKTKIKNDYEGGLSSNVNATPTFFINGSHMPQVQSYEEFKQVILGVPAVTATPTPVK